MPPRKHYSHHPSAQALLFRSPKTGGKALRVACRSILKEFTDNAYIGTDPDGMLYYDNVSDLTGTCEYKVAREVDEGVVYAHIIFFHDINYPFAEFIGEDPTEAVRAADMDGYRTSGSWEKLMATETPATITRQLGSNIVTLILDPDHPDNFAEFKKATITLSSSLTLSVSSLNAAQGNFTFKDTHKLVNEGLCANWTGDRVVFYKDDNVAKDWVGFFMPNEGVNIGEPVPSTGVFKGVVWGRK